MLLNTGEGDPQKTLDFLIRIRRSVMATASMPEDQNTLQGLINQASAAVAEKKHRESPEGIRESRGVTIPAMPAVNAAKPIMVLEKGIDLTVYSLPRIDKEPRLQEIPYLRLLWDHRELTQQRDSVVAAMVANAKRWGLIHSSLIELTNRLLNTDTGMWLAKQWPNSLDKLIYDIWIKGEV